MLAELINKVIEPFKARTESQEIQAKTKPVRDRLAVQQEEWNTLQERLVQRTRGNLMQMSDEAAGRAAARLRELEPQIRATQEELTVLATAHGKATDKERDAYFSPRMAEVQAIGDGIEAELRALPPVPRTVEEAAERGRLSGILKFHRRKLHELSDQMMEAARKRQGAPTA